MLGWTIPEYVTYGLLLSVQVSKAYFYRKLLVPACWR